MFIIGILKGTMLDGVRCTESRRVLKCAIDNGTLEIKILMLRAEPLKMGAERYFAVMYMAAGVPYCRLQTFLLISCIMRQKKTTTTFCLIKEERVQEEPIHDIVRPHVQRRLPVNWGLHLMMKCCSRCKLVVYNMWTVNGKCMVVYLHAVSCRKPVMNEKIETAEDHSISEELKESTLNEVMLCDLDTLWYTAINLRT
ncbi:hypothetical protein L208DRAFT_1380440 [Tricholoma matsutake]|nr:hypothetical protein L208DRAFT_1380440 [Tricholoma matsutake 945]